MGKAIVYATPVFILLMLIELAWGWHLQRRGKGKNTYRLADAINSLSLGMMSQFTAVFTRLLRLGIYTFIYSSVSLVPLEAAKAFWNTWYGWCLALVFYDFCYYWLHRAGHETAIFWAAHVVHHKTTTCPPRCAKPAAAHCWAGCSTYPWRWPGCRLWCLASWH
jgi:alkylglycerol monooxygenase